MGNVASEFIHKKLELSCAECTYSKAGGMVCTKGVYTTDGKCGYFKKADKEKV